MPCTNPTGQNACPVIPAGYDVGDLVPCDGTANASDPVTKVGSTRPAPSGETNCDCRQRTLTARAARAAAGQYLRDRHFERDGHPHGVKFPAHAQRVLHNRVRLPASMRRWRRAGGKGVRLRRWGRCRVPAGCPGPNNDTTYGGCRTHCTWGPFCGDDVVANAPRSNATSAAPKTTRTMATRAVVPRRASSLASYCGDGVVDSDFGEQCDSGPNNGGAGQPCSSSCKVIITQR